MSSVWRKAAAGIACAVTIAAAQWVAALQINEFMVNAPGGGDNGREYVELIGGPSESVAGVTLLIVSNEVLPIGEIINAVPLSGSTGANGLFLIRDSATVLSPAPDGATTVQVTDFSPDIDHDYPVVMLVTNFTGLVGDDLDTNDDGILDVTPWTALLDVIAVTNGAGGEPDIALGLGGTSINGSAGSFTPDAIIRNPNNPVEVIGFDVTSVLTNGPYTPSIIETTDPAWTFDLTPGGLNPGFDSDKAAQLNEVFINVPSPDSDNGNEFVEIRANPGESMDDVWFLLIDNQGTNIGVVANAVDLSSAVSAGPNGLLLIRDSATVLNDPPAAATRLLISDFSPDLNNNSNVFMLVTGFSGLVGDDLDTNDDGTLETTPWTTILDAVGVDDGEGEPAIVLGLGGVSTGSQSFTPDFFLRTANLQDLVVGDAVGGPSPGPWMIDLESDPVDYVGQDLTPGNPNFNTIIVSAPATKVEFFRIDDND